MIALDTENPFPLLVSGRHSYQDEQSHSALVDQFLGIKVDETEEIVEKRITGSHERKEAWIGLAPQSLLTPYSEIRSILENLKPKDGSTVVDLGAGYGRMGFVIARHFPNVSFLGIEILQERVIEGVRAFERAALPSSISLVQGDLAEAGFEIPSAEYYFVYDFGTRDSVAKTLEDLRIISGQRAITVVARGGRSRDLIDRQCPWLSQVVEPRHFPHYSIYRTSLGA